MLRPPPEVPNLVPGHAQSVQGFFQACGNRLPMNVVKEERVDPIWVSMYCEP